MSGTILVTGATGNTGRHVVRGLLAAGTPLRTGTRTAPPPESAATAPHIRFDWSDPETYAAALSGVDRVYLVPPVGVLDPVPAIDRFLDDALAAGVRRVVFLSHDLMPPNAPGLDQARLAIRRMPEWAVLRPSWFMQNLLSDTHHMGRSLRERDELVSATDGRGIGLVDAADIAEVGVRALLDDRPNAEYVITGPEILTYDDVAATLRDVLGRPVRHLRLTTDDLAGRMTDVGIPRQFAEILAASERLIANGAEERVTDTVLKTTGHPPRPLRAFLRHHRDHFRSDQAKPTSA